MGEAFRVVLLVGLVAALLTTGALGLSWWMEPDRRIRRALSKALGGASEAEAVSVAEGKACALNFSGGQLVVLWGLGAHGLAYDFDEVEGGEIIVDGHVVARARRGAVRKDLDIVVPEAEQVVLRLMFADARNPEFEMALWNADLPASTGSPTEALRLGRRWLSHVEALMKR